MANPPNTPPCPKCGQVPGFVFFTLELWVAHPDATISMAGLLSLDPTAHVQCQKCQHPFMLRHEAKDALIAQLQEDYAESGGLVIAAADLEGLAQAEQELCN